MAEETSLVADWLFDTLAADSAGAGSLGVLSTGITDRIYDSLIDQAQATYPAIVFNMQDSRELLAAGGDTVLVLMVWQVQVVGENHAYSELSPIADRIKTLIHKGSGVVTGGRIISCVRSDTNARSIVRYNEMIDGVSFRHLGGFYRIQARAE
jgi:hypothetical protein